MDQAMHCQQTTELLQQTVFFRTTQDRGTEAEQVGERCDLLVDIDVVI